MDNRAQIQVALKMFIDQGLPVFPVCPPDHKGVSAGHLEKCKTPGKRPLIKGWRKHTETTLEQAQTWVNQFPSFNLGLPLGLSSNLVGIDVDGEKGAEILMQVSKGLLPETWEFTTSAGRRLLYALPMGIETRKHKIQADGIHEECAFLCEGQYTVMPPSIHPSGDVYTWVSGRTPDDMEAALAPPWLIQLIKTNEQYVAATNISDIPREFNDITMFSSFVPEANTSVAPPKTQKAIQVSEEMWNQSVSEGGRNNHMIKLVGSLCASPVNRKAGMEAILAMALQLNEVHCKPPLERNEVEEMVTNIYQTEVSKTAKYNNEDKKFNAVEFLPSVLEYMQQRAIEIVFEATEGLFYVYNQSVGIWQVCGVDGLQVQAVVREALMCHDVGGKPSWGISRNIIEVMNQLRIVKRTTDSYGKSMFDMGIHREHYRRYICFQNGLYYWEQDQLLPHNKDEYPLISFPVNYDPDADCPFWKATLADWLNNDQDTIAFLQEFIGTCLVPTTGQRTALFLLGHGSNGKSLFLDGLKDLFGGEAMWHANLERLQGRFDLAYLKNKLINVCGDLESTYIKKTGVIKGLITGDPVTAEIKKGNSFTIHPIAKFIFALNEMPKSSDKTAGWHSRIKIIKFENYYEPSSSFAREFQTQVGVEASGIINWALEGLRRFNAAGKFTESKHVEQSQSEYKQENDNVLGFINAVLQPGHTERTASDGADVIACTPIFETYKLWCEHEGTYPVAKKIFNKRFEASGIEKKRANVGRKTQLSFLGLKFKHNYELFEELWQEYAAHAGLNPVYSVEVPRVV